MCRIGGSQAKRMRQLTLSLAAAVAAADGLLAALPASHYDCAIQAGCTERASEVERRPRE